MIEKEGMQNFDIEIREVLIFWWEEGLYAITRDEALVILIDTFDMDYIDLKPLAHDLKSHRSVRRKTTAKEKILSKQPSLHHNSLSQQLLVSRSSSLQMKTICSVPQHVTSTGSKYSVSFAQSVASSDPAQLKRERSVSLRYKSASKEDLEKMHALREQELNNLTRKLKANRNVDVTFLIDCTSSMKPKNK